MKFLIDAQLPRRLAHQLRVVGFETTHTLDLPEGNRTTDQVLITLSLTDHCVLVAPKIEECEFQVSGTLANRGVGFGGFVSSGVRSSILRSSITVIGKHKLWRLGIAFTDLIGGPVTGTGWVGCIAVADEGAVFYTNTCPQ